MADEFGGTKVKRGNKMGGGPSPQQIQQMQMQQQMQQQQQMQMQQQGPPPAMNPRMQQQMQQQMQMPPQMQQQVQQQVPQEVLMPKLDLKSKFGSSMDSKSFKTSLLVVIIFLMFNSKIIWKQITRFPMMGEFDPSIVALIVNALLAGIVFYLLSKLI